MNVNELKSIDQSLTFIGPGIYIQEGMPKTAHPLDLFITLDTKPTFT